MSSAGKYVRSTRKNTSSGEGCFSQEESTGIVHQELLFIEPVPFETILNWAPEHAPMRSVERIHVKHARTKDAAKPKARVKQSTKKGAVKKKARVSRPVGAKRRTNKAP
jgi:hypothetical protein